MNHVVAKTNQTMLVEASSNGVITDLKRLLRSRHWAGALKLFSHQAARNMLLGNVRSRFRGRGMEFEEVRRYQPGDDIRTIDWKVSARTGETFTKLFCEERERPCHILVDQRHSLFFGSARQFKSVLAAEVATALAWAALAGGDRVGGQVLGNFVERDSRAKRSKQAVLKLIHDINDLNHQLYAPDSKSLQSAQPVSLSNSLEECRRITRPGTAIFIISDFYDFDAAAAKALRNLGKHADVTLLQVSDALEEELPKLGNAAVSNGEQSVLVNLSGALQTAYQTEIKRRQDHLKSAATQARAMYAKLSTAQTARQALSNIFSSRIKPRKRT